MSSMTRRGARGRAGLQPRVGVAAALLEAIDRLGLLQGQADLVEPVKQAVPEEGVDFEADFAVVGRGDGLALQIHGEDCVAAALGDRECA